MKYTNASDVLPEHLLKEIQQYAAGKLLYIPSGNERKAWGTSSGFRNQLQRRNMMIRNKYAHGTTMSELADEYYLSMDSIKKIIYSKHNHTDLLFAPIVESAVTYANIGMLEEWILCYLLLQLKADHKAHPATQPLYYGVIKFPLRLIEYDSNGNQGDDGTKHIEQDASESQLLVNLCDQYTPYKLNRQTVPLVVHYHEGKFYCKIQPNLLVSLRKTKVNVYPTIIVLDDNAQYKRFMQYFGNVFIYVNNEDL